MTTYLQEPHRLDSNVTIKVPERIVVHYKHPNGWYIELDGQIVGTMVDGGHDYAGDDRLEITYFNDVSDATDWLIQRNLIKTSAYDELHKKIKKVAKKKTKSA